MDLKTVLAGYLLVISVLSAGVTIYDKIAAKKLPRRRVPEKTLLTLGFAGGAAAMWTVMLLIRHKTRHKKFMITLPVFAVLHAAAAIYLLCRP